MGRKVAIFLVPKHRRRPSLAAVLNARAEHAPRPAHSCQWSKWIDGRAALVELLKKLSQMQSRGFGVAAIGCFFMKTLKIPRS